jgi:hypothetical protein
MAVRRCADARLQVCPGGRHESPSAVWKHQYEPERAMTSHPAQDHQGLALEWMAASDDRDLRRKCFEVGSVLPFRSTRSIGTGYGSSYGTGSMMGDLSGS